MMSNMEKVEDHSERPVKLQYSDLIFHEKLGQGGFGTVNRVTFKQQHIGYVQAAAKSVAEVRKEIEIMTNLNHPNIVKLYGFMEAPMNLYIILLEYAPFGTVHDYLKRQSDLIHLNLLVKWSKESALAMEYLHKNKILHRDIKPSNALLFENNLLKLSDFGLAREIKRTMTTSTAKGTSRYMAPEVHRDDHFSFGSDLYAYGMLVLEMATGKEPFDGMETAHVVYMVGTSNMKPKVPDYIPEPIAKLLMQCWNSSPSNRPTASEAVEVMSGLSTQSHTPVLRIAAQPTKEPGVHTWRIVTKFGKEGNAYGEIKQADGITVCDNNDIAITDYELLRVNVFTEDGRYKCSLESPRDNIKAKLFYPYDVAVTTQGHIAIVDGTKHVKVFDVDGVYQYTFSTLGNNETDTKVVPQSIVVSPGGNILIGDKERECVTAHSESGVDLIHKVNLSIAPHFLATNNYQQIFASDWILREVVGVDFSGRKLFTLNNFVVDGERGLPQGLACGDDNSIYLAVKIFDNSTGKVLPNSGHIHQYTHTGLFVQCIMKGLYSPRALTWHKSKLYVADEMSVIILGTSSSSSPH